MTDDADRIRKDICAVQLEAVEVRTRQEMLQGEFRDKQDALLEEFKQHEDHDDKRFAGISVKMDKFTDQIVNNKMEIQKLLIKMTAVISVMVVVGQALALNLSKLWGGE